MKNRIVATLTLAGLASLHIGCQLSKKTTTNDSKSSKKLKTSVAMTLEPKQVTYSGLRSTDARITADGQYMLFLSERDDGNPFYQVYVKNIASGETYRTTPGHGKIGSVDVSPRGTHVLFSSTHRDSRSKELQKQELELRANGKQQRYAMDFDQNFDIYRSTRTGRFVAKLTHTVGFDGEARYSADGKKIVFVSNRNGYLKELTKEDRAGFEKDPSYMADIFIMNSDGQNENQLTSASGYDGGPVFHPSGKKIAWHRVKPQSQTTEIFTMNSDGSEQKQITTLNKISWSPAYHPSGDYIVFSTNFHGDQNFELYMIDSQGLSSPVRVTDAEGFDGSPSFSPDGKILYWTKNIKGREQIFHSPWNESRARRLLGLPPKTPTIQDLSQDITQSDIQTLVEYLASKKMRGRLTGSPEELEATETMAHLFEEMKLLPGNKGSFFHSFDFISGVEPGPNNQLMIDGIDEAPVYDETWRPLAQSKVGKTPPSPAVFVGYGIVAPGNGHLPAYNSYGDADVKDKWAVMFRYVPEDLPADEKAHLHRYSNLSFKIMSARNRGARGVIFVSGPTSGVKEELIPLTFDSAASESSIPVVSIADSTAEMMLKKVNLSLEDVQKKLDAGKEIVTIPLEGLSIASETDIKHKMAKGRNVIARLKVPGAKKTVIVGAHIDHLGEGRKQTSLAKSADKDLIHYGADDNASGVAAVMELAHYLANHRRGLRQNIIFALWSGEELGTLGSSSYVQSLKKNQKKLHPSYSSYINMDMIGRLRDKLTVQGIGSSNYWPTLIENIGQKLAVPIQTQVDPYLPTDSMVFYMAGLPTLNFFTGGHTEYHTPRDTPDTLNFQGITNITKSIERFISSVASRSSSPEYNKVKRTGHGQGGNRRFRIYLGTIPDYTGKKVKGVRISGVVKGGPAEKAGLRDGDVIVACGENKIENIYDYVYSLQAMKPGKKTSIVVMRDGQRRELDIVPLSRE